MPKLLKVTMGIAAALCLGGLVLPFASGGSVLGKTNAVHSRSYWKAKYRRPSQIPFPKSDPYSEAKANLGRMLFWDPILSGSRTRSCASCHNPGLSWGDGLPRAIGEDQKALPLRTPTLLNVAWIDQFGWTGHFQSLEDVTFGPITGAANMNLPKKTLIKRLSAIPGYEVAFQHAFGEGKITPKKIELALATFQRTIVSTEAPFDRWIAGNKNAISEAAKRGFDLFNNKGRCASCHQGWTFTDGSFHDVGSAKGKDIGRGKLFPTSVKLQYAFKTPTLRDVARRAPYMHDGSVSTLEEVIDLYNKGGIDRPSRAEDVRPLHLTESEKADLVAFLKTLNGAPRDVVVPVLPR
ncbi:MAG: cytochrome c peroxidase [Pseudolabrys sp.]